MDSLFYGFITALLLGPAVVRGQGWSEGKNLYELSRAMSGDLKQGFLMQAEAAAFDLNTGIAFYRPFPPSLRTLPPFASSRETNAPSLAPHWSAECLPFFCRIEHNLGKVSVVPVKFRLGSVEYVDWLEGKSDFVPK